MTAALHVKSDTRRLLIPQPPSSSLFPYTTLFRSSCAHGCAAALLGGAVPRWMIPRPDEVFSNGEQDRKSTRLNSSHVEISYAVFCLKKKNLFGPDSALISVQFKIGRSHV